ncbi:hypothetical protein N24_1738 [Corynebacterium suranareeae]|uniref:Uncharacterized protein n=1 Tax=Corynebacterium suranareeae TaxID=2506452 RepID=A0A160PTY9_9CORY|nr:putative Ig domain-containing protein [Corynebacterium suranareeae]BAU96000.1 hypothetical protein N24_1738 [Corynebacterium suranareeae]
MKLFSRTSLVALGTAAAITVSGVTAPAFAQEETTTEITAPAVTIEETTEVETPVASEAATLKIEQPGLISGNVNQAINTVTIEVSSGVAETFEATGLPTGIFINNAGEIFGTPTKEFSGSAQVTATAADGSQSKVAVNFSIGEEPSNGSSDTDEISNWIKIITAVIGALTTILTFGTKLDSFLK